jgi:hypothetical protein
MFNVVVVPGVKDAPVGNRIAPVVVESTDTYPAGVGHEKT